MVLNLWKPRILSSVLSTTASVSKDVTEDTGAVSEICSAAERNEWAPGLAVLLHPQQPNHLEEGKQRHFYSVLTISLEVKHARWFKHSFHHC